MIRLFTLPAGFLLDLLMGDPRWLYHPVCLIGKLISVLEKGIRKVFPKSEKGELAGGVLMKSSDAPDHISGSFWHHPSAL